MALILLFFSFLLAILQVIMLHSQEYPNTDQHSPVAEQKAQEYTERIRKGEDVRHILNGLPKTLLSALLRRAYYSLIPAEYRARTSQELTEHWNLPLIDITKMAQEQANQRFVIMCLQYHEQTSPCSSDEPYCQAKNEQWSEAFFSREHTFDTEKARQIIQVLKDWTIYGDTLYAHLVGRALRLQKGVDYNARDPKGPVDLREFQQARSRYVEKWLQNPGNRQWFNALEAFHQEHKNKDLSFAKKTVRIRHPDGTIHEKQRWTTPYSYQDGWIYYETNYFDEARASFVQPDREKTRYRAYINVECKDIVPTFSNIIAELRAHAALQKVGFQMKIADENIYGDTEEERSTERERAALKVMRQRDKIVLYLGDEGMRHALPILQAYAAKNAHTLSNEGVLLAQPLIDTHGKSIPGITITSAVTGLSPDPADKSPEYTSFNKMQEKIIEASLRTIRQALQDPQAVARIDTAKPRLALRQRLASLSPGVSLREFVQIFMTDAEGEAFLQNNLQQVYPQWAKAFGMKETAIAFKEHPVNA